MPFDVSFGCAGCGQRLWRAVHENQRLRRRQFALTCPPLLMCCGPHAISRSVPPHIHRAASSVRGSATDGGGCAGHPPLDIRGGSTQPGGFIHALQPARRPLRCSRQCRMEGMRLHGLVDIRDALRHRVESPGSFLSVPACGGGPRVLESSVRNSVGMRPRTRSGILDWILSNKTMATR